MEDFVSVKAGKKMCGKRCMAPRVQDLHGPNKEEGWLI